MRIMLGDHRVPTRCWARNNHGYQCGEHSMYIVFVHGVEDSINSCRQHLAKVTDYVAVTSGQSPAAPMMVRIMTIPQVQ